MSLLTPHRCYLRWLAYQVSLCLHIVLLHLPDVQQHFTWMLKRYSPSSLSIYGVSVWARQKRRSWLQMEIRAEAKYCINLWQRAGWGTSAELGNPCIVTCDSPICHNRWCVTSLSSIDKVQRLIKAWGSFKPLRRALRAVTVALIYRQQSFCYQKPPWKTISFIFWS